MILHIVNRLVSSTFTQEQKSDFKFERNNDLTFIVIITDIDWYEKCYHFWPYLPAILTDVYTLVENGIFQRVIFNIIQCYVIITDEYM